MRVLRLHVLRWRLRALSLRVLPLIGIVWLNFHAFFNSLWLPSMRARSHASASSHADLTSAPLMNVDGIFLGLAYVYQRQGFSLLEALKNTK